jgi:hypothetical protein
MGNGKGNERSRGGVRHGSSVCGECGTLHGGSKKGSAGKIDSNRWAHSLVSKVRHEEIACTMTITDDGAIGISMTMSGLEVVAFTSTYGCTKEIRYGPPV